ncbi:MAG: sn-glycerol-3-phosphate ABC transporter ATP-binding protein UgpC [Streptosporangiales bacterium]|nr:sn-glycerol-3-phosphate ABC transporter ATP-binding protein UgpC [Streptosporangiales bacterium]
MATVTLEKVTKRYGDVEAVRDLDLDIDDGRFTVLVGPSGCGKTSTLRMVAGLEPVTSGRVWIGPTDVTRLEPKDRDVAMVFQNYALYPHLTVRENIAFPLRARALSRTEVDRRVGDAARSLGIEALLGRKPRALSGGQQQRVAIGRAIVRQPHVFLFDEPLSNLDAKLRVEMRTELARLQRELGTTALYVTHDQEEAMTLSDEMVVLRDGEVAQRGAPADLYARPVDVFVAGFVGSPRMNLVKADAGDGTVHVGAARIERAGVPSGPVTVGVRPEDVLVGAAASAPDLRARVELVELLGPRAIVTLDADGMTLTAVVEARHLDGVHEGVTVPVTLSRDDLHLFGPDDRRLEDS